jgi:serine/threonine protein kinase
LFTSRYKLGRIIRQGKYSTIHSGTDEISKNRVAIKVIKRNGLPEEELEALHAEVDILFNLQHPNIMEALDFYEEINACYFVMEYVGGGDLFDRIVKKKFYPERQARLLVYNLLQAIQYLHDHDIVHG